MNISYYAYIKGVKITKGLAALFLTASLLLIFPVSSFANTNKQAATYREKGFKAQQVGDYDTALSFYQKAVQIDPYYAAAYNDLGVIYETKGLLDLAEDNYLRSVGLDENYLSAYYNLAALYEKRDMSLRALYYWKKRIEKGIKGEEWTEKAKKNLYALAEKCPDAKTEIKNTEAAELAQELSRQRKKEFEDTLTYAHQHFKAGQSLYQQRQYVKAVEEFDAALSLTPDAPEILEARQNAMKDLVAERINEHYELGRRLFELGDYPSARAEINKALSLIPEDSNQKSR